MKKLFTYIGYFIATCTLIGILWGVFKGTNALINVVESQDKVVQGIDSLTMKVNDLNIKINEVSENTVLIGNYVEGVNKALDYHVRKSPEVTKEDYAAMMQIIEELKKNGQPIAQK